MTSEIDKLKHFHVENYSGIYFTDELNGSAPWEINLVQKLFEDVTVELEKEAY